MTLGNPPRLSGLRTQVPVTFLFGIGFLLLSVVSGPAWAQIPGEEPRLGPMDDRTTQADAQAGGLSNKKLRKAGLKIFTTPFNQYDGYGDGSLNPADTTSPGGRPTLQDNGTFLRVNGLDAQTCLECHGIVSNATVPATLGIGGSGTTATVAMFMTKDIDPDDSDLNGFAAFNGRLIVPPALYGVGGVQLVGKEMTAELQSLKAQAIATPGVPVNLVAKGVDFGSLVMEQGELDFSNVEGVDEDLVIRPFGRKGEFPSVRQFDQGAMEFHLGMQTVDIVGPNVDGDGDGVTNEILVGELSALEFFLTTQDRPVEDAPSSRSAAGEQLFSNIGCADCHVPEMHTATKMLPYSFPEVNTDMTANVYREFNLAKKPTKFQRNDNGGIVVRMFSDLKRHDMGPDLAEDFFAADPQRNSEFITAKLWGVADTAPYLHDGRAQTLLEAILLHGGEAQTARDAFDCLDEAAKGDVIMFLRTLRTPKQPNKDVVPNTQKRKGGRLDPLEEDCYDEDEEADADQP